MFTSSLESASTMCQSFLNDTWDQVYELRLNGDEPVSETNWSKTLKSHKKPNPLIIHIVLKPSDLTSEHEKLVSSEYWPAVPQSLVLYADPYRDAFTQNMTENTTRRLPPRLNGPLDLNGIPAQEWEGSHVSIPPYSYSDLDGVTQHSRETGVGYERRPSRAAPRKWTDQGRISDDDSRKSYPNRRRRSRSNDSRYYYEDLRAHSPGSLISSAPDAPHDIVEPWPSRPASYSRFIDHGEPDMGIICVKLVV